MLAWTEAYRPLLGKQLEGAAFLPISSDTPGLAVALNNHSFWFSGVVQLAFSETDLFLTWEQRGEDIVLIPEFENRFFRDRFFDRINLSYEEPWGFLRGAQLTGVQTFTVSDVAHDQAIAIRHNFRADTLDAFLWVCSGYEPQIGGGDDLFISLERDLPNGVEVIPMDSFEM